MADNLQINIIPRIDAKDKSKITSRELDRKFGKKNDYIEFHIYDMGGTLLYTIDDYQDWQYPDQLEDVENPSLTNTLFVDPTKKLTDLGFRSGQFSCVYNLQRRKIYNDIPRKFYIGDISPSRTELKIYSELHEGEGFIRDIQSYMNQLEQSSFAKDFVLNFGNNKNILAINLAVSVKENCALVKLYEPLPVDIEEKDNFRVAEDVIDPIEFIVDLGTPEVEDDGIPLRGPNFRIDTRLNDSVPSAYKTYNSFLEGANSASLYNVLSHLSESVNLSIDYTKTGTGSLETGYHFENFTHFGSAEERLRNFKYKLNLIELYEAQIEDIGTITGNISGSTTVINNRNAIESKRAKIISTFDNYEKFLYYEQHPYAWPKQPDFGIGNLQITGSVALVPTSSWLEVGLTDCDVFFKPFKLYPTTSDIAKEWFGNLDEYSVEYGGQILSASRFDRDNGYNLQKTLPQHILEREENESYVTFTNMIGHYFDQIWIYIDHISKIRNAHNSFTEGISKDLVFTALQSLGIEAFDQFENEELFEYIIGTNKAKSGSFGTYVAPPGQTMITADIVKCDHGGSSIPKGDITKEVWKRLYHNLPFLLKTKGTERGIRALMSCYGVPETILNIKEYGGPTTDETTYKTFNYEKFSYTLKGDSGTDGFFIESPWYIDDPAFTGVYVSQPGKAKGQIVCSMGTIGENFDPPFPKTIELQATDHVEGTTFGQSGYSIHTFSSGIEFEIHAESGLITAQSITNAIDAHPLFSASLEVPKDLYHYNHYKYNLDLVIKLEQHLVGDTGNTPIEGSLFEDTTTPACDNPQQFPQVEFLTKHDFGSGGEEETGGGQNNSTSVTTVVPGTDSCESKTIIENGIKWDGSGTLINNGLFQDENELMDFVTDCTNGYCSYDISTFSFESVNPAKIPLYMGEEQCMGVNGYGLFVIECFEVDPTCVKHSNAKGGLCNANFTLHVSDANVDINLTAEQLIDYLFMGDSGDANITNDLLIAIPNAEGAFVWDENLNSYNGNINTLDSSEDGGGNIYWSSPSINASAYLTGLEIINYLSTNCEHTGGITGNCYKIYDNLITDLNAEGYVNAAIPGINTDTIFSELITPDVTTTFPPSSSCGCDDFTVMTGPGNQAEALLVWPSSGGAGCTNAEGWVELCPDNNTTSAFTGLTVILEDSSGTLHTFTISGSSNIDKMQNLTAQIDANNNFGAVYVDDGTSPNKGLAVKITTADCSAAANTVITGTLIDYSGEAAFCVSKIDFTGGTDAVLGANCVDDLDGETLILQDTSGTQHTFTINGITALSQMQNLSNAIDLNSEFSSTYSTVPNRVEIVQANVGVIGNTQMSGTATLVQDTNGDPCMYTQKSPPKWEFVAGTDAGSSAGTSTTTTLLQAPPTVNATATLQAGAQAGAYGKFGAKFFADTNSGNFHGNNTNTYFGNPSENTTDGRLNQIGVWDDTDTYNPGGGAMQAMNPYNQWIGFSECITVPSDGEYLIGLAGDNQIRFLVDGQIVIEKDFDSGENFNYWWVYKINLTAGDHVINLEGWNSGFIASFGCDIVGPFPANTFIDETIFSNIDGGGVNVGGTTYANLEDLYSQNIIFSTENFGNTYNDTCAGKTDTGVVGNGPSAAINAATYIAANNPSTDFNAFTYYDTSVSNTTDVCIDGGQNAEKLFITHITIDVSGYPAFSALHGNTYYNWDDLVTDVETVTGTLPVTTFNQIEDELGEGQNIYIHTDYCLCTTTIGGGTFNTSTNTCDENDGYFYNECTGYCEKTETITSVTPTTCGLIQSPIGNGTFANSTEFLDFFTTYANGFYGYNVDEYFYETFEPLPQGETVESPCLGPNNGYIRRIMGFKKDPNVLPFDDTLYINYQTFLQQLNTDGHQVEEGMDSVMFSLLMTALILTEAEGPCDHKTFIENPNSSTGAFEGNLINQVTPIQEFMDYYSDITTNDTNLGLLQNIDISTLKFNIAENSLSQVFQQTCPIDATIYCFYDGTSMPTETARSVMQTVENWVGEQGASFTGIVYHMVSAHERWLDVARLPFTNIGDHLGNGGTGSISTCYSDNDTISSAQPQPAAAVSSNTSGHTWHRIVEYGTSDSKSKAMKNDLWNGGHTIVIDGATVNLKDVINDGQGLYDDHHPNTTSGLTGHAWRGPAPSLTGSGEKALCFNFYDESGQHGGSGAQDYQYHSFANNTTPTFSHINCSQAKIEGTKKGKKHYRSDYELYIKTYLENIDRSALEYEDQGDLIHIMYPSAPIGLSGGNNQALGNDGSTYFGYTQLAFPLHALGTILTGSAGENPGMLATGHEILGPNASIAIKFDALDGNGGSNTNPYCDSTWANTSTFGPPPGYDASYGYGGLQQYGWNLTAESIKENPFTPTEFEDAVNTVVGETLCADWESDIGVSSVTCKEDDGVGGFNYTFTIDKFFIDPLVDVNQTPFTTYTGFITHATTGLGANNVVGISLNDDWTDTEIGGDIIADECLCAEECPDTLIINDNTEITITGSILTGVFNMSEEVTQIGNIGFTADIIEINPGVDDKAIIIDITNGILDKELDILGSTSAALLSSTTVNQFKVTGYTQDGFFEIGESVTQGGNGTLVATVTEISPNQLVAIPPTIVLEVTAGSVSNYGQLVGGTSGATMEEVFTVIPFGEHLIPLPQGAFGSFDEFMDFISEDSTLKSTDISTLKFELATEYVTSTTISAQTLEPGGIWYSEPANYQLASSTVPAGLMGGYQFGSPNPSFYANEGTANSWSVVANDRIGSFQIGEELNQSGNPGLQAVVGHLIAKPYYGDAINFPGTDLQFQYRLIIYLSDTSSAIDDSPSCSPLMGVNSGAQMGDPNKTGLLKNNVGIPSIIIAAENTYSDGPNYRATTMTGDYYNQGNEGRSEPLHRIDLPTTSTIPGGTCVVDTGIKTSTTMYGQYSPAGSIFASYDEAYWAHREQTKIAWEWYAQNAEAQDPRDNKTETNEVKYFSGMGFNSLWGTGNTHFLQEISYLNDMWNRPDYGLGDPDYWMDYDGDGDGDLQGRRHVDSEIIQCPAGMAGPKAGETNHGGGYATPYYLQLRGYDYSYYGYNKFYSNGDGSGTSWLPNPQNPNHDLGYENKVERVHGWGAAQTGYRNNYVSRQNIITHTNYPYYGFLSQTACEFPTQVPATDNCNLPEASGGDTMAEHWVEYWYSWKSCIDAINVIRTDETILAATCGSGSYATGWDDANPFTDNTVGTHAEGYPTRGAFNYDTPFNVIEAELYYVQYGNSQVGDHTRPGFKDRDDNYPAPTDNTGGGSLAEQHEYDEVNYPNKEYEFFVDFGSKIPQCVQLEENQDVTETTTITYDVNNLLCLGPNSALRNKYGLFTIQGFYQNSIIDPVSTVYEYPTDTNYYTTWEDFLNSKIPETGNTGEHWDENWLGAYQLPGGTAGTDLSLSTTYHNTTASVELANTEYTVAGEDYITTINEFMYSPFNTVQDFYSNPKFSGIESTDAFLQLSWMLGEQGVITLNGNVCGPLPTNGWTQQITNYFFVNMDYDNTTTNNGCTCGPAEYDNAVIVQNLPPISPTNNGGNSSCNGEGLFVRPTRIYVNTDYQFETALDSNGNAISWVAGVTNLANDADYNIIQSFVNELILAHNVAGHGVWQIGGIDVDSTLQTGPNFMTIINEICPDPTKRGRTNDKLLYISEYTAQCDDVPGPIINPGPTDYPNIMAPIVGQIDGAACKCAPVASGGEPLPGDIEYESCTCCPESSSIEYGCPVPGPISSSRCECVLPTYTTVVTVIPPEPIIDCHVTASSKTVEFRINPRRLDDARGLTPLQVCCGPTGSAQSNIHLFSLYNPNFPGSDPHLLLTPYVGSDISSSNDYKQWGSLSLAVNGVERATSSLFPAFNGDFWNIFIGTEGKSGSSDWVDFGAYQSNFLGNVTYTTGSALFTEYERAVTFGDAANNCDNTTPATHAYFGGHPHNTEAYSGSFQEIKYHTTEYLNHDTLIKHALDPFQYAGNTVSSSWDNVYLRLPLGSNNKIDTDSYMNRHIQYHGTGHVKNFNPHPEFDLYHSESISSVMVSQSFGAVYETHRHLTPDTVGISTTSEKVRIDSGSVDRSILSFDIKSETSTLDRQPLDYNDLGVFFSPQAEINEDIVYTLGAFRMDDYIGDPKHQKLKDYPDLSKLRLTYFKKYLNTYRQNFWDYLKTIQYLDHTLFKIVEQHVPAKANLKTGLLIEPHYLERQKFARNIPTIERLERETLIPIHPPLEGNLPVYNACINISDVEDENMWRDGQGHATQSDYRHMSQSKYGSPGSCQTNYVTLWDNMHPILTFDGCRTSKTYYYVPQPIGRNVPLVIDLNIQPQLPTSPVGSSNWAISEQAAGLGESSESPGGGGGGAVG